MEGTISNYLSDMELGKPQEFKNMGVIPLFTSTNDSLKYLTLKDALEKHLLTVTEVSQGGSVPELEVKNEAEIPVLLLDGEELIGAKQNRALNTTILLRARSDTLIPVSCTEQGRWTYVSEQFGDSEAVASPRLRTVKASSVAASLAESGVYDSDQGAVWDEIEEISASAKVHSPTHAMRDVYKSKVSDLDEYLSAFEHMPHQKGLLVFVNGKVTGLDIVSLESAYEALHPKLVKSYAMDALLQKKRKNGKPSINVAKGFLQEVMACEEQKYKSVGHGWDHRFHGTAIVGSALLYRKKVIHTAFFRTSQTDKTGTISSYTRRRQYRI